MLQLSGVQGMCRKHAEEGHTIPKRTCLYDDCQVSRHRAGLCGRHFTLEAENVNPCHALGCKAPVWNADYCGNHKQQEELGVDLIEPDWFDWVAAERLFHGQDLGRKPTAAEVLAACERAERTGMQYSELAARIGVEYDVFERWRYHSAMALKGLQVAA